MIRLDCDDNALDIVDKFDKALAPHGLTLRDDGKSHDGFILLALEKLDANPNPDHRPDHDSLFVKLEQLEALIEDAADAGSNVAYGQRRLSDVRQLVRLIRGQVLK